VRIDGGSLTLYSGGLHSNNVTGATGVAGVIVNGADSTFSMDGGQIYDLTSAEGTAAVEIQEGATFLMRGGVITANRTDADGEDAAAGVAVKEGLFEMTGGDITENTGGHAVSVSSDGEMRVSGSVHIGFNNADNGVYLAADQNIVITADLPEDARIVLADKVGAVNGTKVAQKLPAEGESVPVLSASEAGRLVWQLGTFSVGMGTGGSSEFYVLANRNVDYVSAVADGTANTVRSTKLTLTFSEDIAGLALGDITLTPAGAASVTMGLLTYIGQDGSGIYELAISGTWDEGDTVAAAVAKSGFTITPTTQSATLHDGAPPAITYISATADGAANLTTSTKISLVFNDDIAGLTAGDITLAPSGVAVVDKGTLTHTGTAGSGTYELAISGTWDEGDTAAVAVAKSGFTITPTTHTATLHKEIPPPPGTVYTLSFDKNADDAVAGSVPDKDVSYGEPVGALPGIDSGAPTRSEYVFQGWATNSAATAPDFTATTVWSVHSDGTAYAVWEPEGTIVPPPPGPDDEDDDDSDDDDPIVIPPPGGGDDETIATPPPATPPPVSPNPGSSGGTQTVDDAPVTSAPQAESDGDEVVTQEELSERAREADIPVLDIGETEVPLLGVEGYSYWSLVDLAIALLGILCALWYVFVYRRRRAQDSKSTADSGAGQGRPMAPPGAGVMHDEPESEAGRRRGMLCIAMFAVAVANILLFLLTQDLTGAPLVIVDVWTIPEAILFAAEILLGYLAIKKEKAAATAPA
jgi:uncharacterized repeat protein (TIGR02543 family)